MSENSSEILVDAFVNNMDTPGMWEQHFNEASVLSSSFATEQRCYHYRRYDACCDQHAAIAI